MELVHQGNIVAITKISVSPCLVSDRSMNDFNSSNYKTQYGNVVEMKSIFLF